MSTNLPRLASSTAGATDAADIVAGASNALVAIDAKAMLFGQGLLSARPVAAIQGRIYWATDVDGGTAYYDTGSLWKLASTALPTVSALPVSPYDGQEIRLQTSTMVTNGCAPWHLRFNSASASAYKWEALGGPAIESFLSPGPQTTASTSMVDLASVGPQIAVEFAGDYLCSFGAYGTSNTASGAAYVSVAGPGVTANAAGDVVMQAAAANSGSQGSTPGIRKTFTGAGVALLKYRSDNAARTASFENRSLIIRPIRIG